MAVYSQTPVAVVGVNNGVVTSGASNTGIRRVLITLLGHHAGTAEAIIDKVLLKAVTKAAEKNNVFTL